MGLFDRSPVVLGSSTGTTGTTGTDAEISTRGYDQDYLRQLTGNGTVTITEYRAINAGTVAITTIRTRLTAAQWELLTGEQTSTVTTPATTGEAQIVAAANLGAAAANSTWALRTISAADVQTVRAHRLRISATGVVAAATAYRLTFPLPLASVKAPLVNVVPESEDAALKGVAITPAVNALGQCIGYDLVLGTALANTDVLDFLVEVQEVA